MPIIAEVRLLKVRREFDRGYSYLVPAGSPARIGSVAAIPFGKADRPAFGIVTGITESDDTASLKELLYVLDAPYVLDAEMISLCATFSDRLLCTFGELARAALPAGLTLQTREFLVLRESDTSAGTDTLSDPAKDLYLMLAGGARIEITDRNRAVCAQLLQRKLARKAYLPQNAANRKFIRVLSLSCDPFCIGEEAFRSLPRAKVALYRELLEYLARIPAKNVPEREACDRFGITPAACKTLEKRGLITISVQSVYRSPYEKENDCPADEDELNAEQRAAFSCVEAKMDAGKGAATLLYGVTGSGKTRVMLRLIRAARQRGRGVIFLVPEIGLTSHTAQALLARFGDEVTVLHSALSDGERHDAWVALKNGEKSIVLGTRSAVFAPVQNLGLIVMDEEQDQSYNADNAPRYHARDIARFRAAHENAVLLLASATPDVESFHKANQGAYSLCRLSSRASGSSLPSVQIVDLRCDLPEKNDRLIGSILQGQIAAALERGEQALLFMNRRGYQFAPFCPSCGHVITCPNCSVSLTLHAQRGRFACCHYCGYSIPAPTVCPSCGAEHLFFKGYGTQRLEEEVRELFPHARVVRMDADTVGQKLSHDKILSEFAAHKADILLGTQMIAKGHDFPDVTLVGVVMADTSLYLGDYRASEEAFALLTQVIGRAGRADRPGHAVIQTLNPDHEIFSLAATQDYDAFFTGEIALRRAVLYPPFCHLCVFTVTGEDERRVNEAALALNEHFASSLEASPEVKVIVYGPLEPAILKVNNQYRKKFVIKHQDDKATRRLFGEALDWFFHTQSPSLKLFYDATPSQI